MTIKEKYPFEWIACCILPDHLHCIWNLPENDSDYSIRWRGIKGLFSKAYIKITGHEAILPKSLKKKREAGIWQRRFWEHMLRTEKDMNTHIDYIHYNPVKHGLVDQVVDWPWSTFHRYMKEGYYDPEWGAKLSDKAFTLENTGE